MADPVNNDMAKNQRIISDAFKIHYGKKDENGVQDTHVETPMPSTVFFNKQNGQVTYEPHFASPIRLRDAEKRDGLYDSIGYDKNNDGKIDESEYVPFAEGFEKLQEASQKGLAKSKPGVIPTITETDDEISVSTTFRQSNIGLMTVDPGQDKDPNDTTAGNNASLMPYVITDQYGPLTHFAFGDDESNKEGIELLRLSIDENKDGDLEEDNEQYYDEIPPKDRAILKEAQALAKEQKIVHDEKNALLSIFSDEKTLYSLNAEDYPGDDKTKASLLKSLSKANDVAKKHDINVDYDFREETLLAGKKSLFTHVHLWIQEQAALPPRPPQK